MHDEPAGQTEHEARVLGVPPAVKEAAPHTSQLLAPGGLNLLSAAQLLHVADAVPAANFPARHTAHSDSALPPRLGYARPTVQFVQAAVAAAVVCLPGGHKPHVDDAVALSVAENLPPAQFVHEDEAASSENLPAGQPEHAVLLVAA